MHLASFAVAGGGAVAALGAVTRECRCSGACVAKAVAGHTAEIPGLAGKYGLEAAGALAEAGLDRRS